MQLPAVSQVRSRPAKPVVLIAAMLIALGGLLALATQAHASEVFNRFQRTCNVWVGCSAFVQSNPPYRPSFPSTCVTNSWTGEGGSYNVPAGRQC